MQSAYDATARKRTVSVTLNGDLYAKAKDAGLNVSQVAETALAAELERKAKEIVRAEIAAEMEAYNAFVAEHGSFADMARDHFKTWNSNDAV